jgi:hypothetical protein
MKCFNQGAFANACVAHHANDETLSHRCKQPLSRFVVPLTRRLHVSACTRLGYTRVMRTWLASSLSRSGIDELAELTDGRRLVPSSSSRSAPTLPQFSNLSCNCRFSPDRLRITGARDLSTTPSSGIGARSGDRDMLFPRSGRTRPR